MTHHLPAPATSFLHQQPPSCSTSDYLPAPPVTSPIPVTTGPDYQRLPCLYQQSDPAPTTSSWILRTGIRHTISEYDSHKKIWPFWNNNLVLSFLPSSLSITYILKVCGINIFISPVTKVLYKKYFSVLIFK